MPAFGERVAEFSINPIIGESGVDRVLVSGLLSIELRKPWIWSFSWAGRYWILAKQNFKSERWGKKDAIKEYQTLTGQHQDEVSSSVAMIQEWPSVSCYHQKQHLPKLEAYNTMSYNFSTKEARVHQKIKTLITSTRRCFSNTYPCIFRRILGPEECWELQRFVKVIEYFTTSSDYIKMCHWF